YVFVPEQWERQQRAAGTRNLILRILQTLVFAGLLVGAAVGGMIAWSRRRYTPRLFLAGATLMLVVSIVKLANGWPMVLASLMTAAPLQLQVLGVFGIGLVGLTLISVLVGLALGALPHALRLSPVLGDRDALRLGTAASSLCHRGREHRVFCSRPAGPSALRRMDGGRARHRLRVDRRLRDVAPIRSHARAARDRHHDHPGLDRPRPYAGVPGGARRLAACGGDCRWTRVVVVPRLAARPLGDYCG